MQIIFQIGYFVPKNQHFFPAVPQGFQNRVILKCQLISNCIWRGASANRTWLVREKPLITQSIIMLLLVTPGSGLAKSISVVSGGSGMYPSWQLTCQGSRSSHWHREMITSTTREVTLQVPVQSIHYLPNSGHGILKRVKASGNFQVGAI